MNKKLAFIIALFSIFAVIMQFNLMLANRVTVISETVVRFFSFFTILTNTIVAGYFSFITYYAFKSNKTIMKSPGILTAITVYITAVGLVYQIILRFTWNPTGMQKIVDEMLHTIIPLLVIIYWYINRKNDTLKYSQIWKWLLFPSVYIVFILIRGHFSNYYPYPFINVTAIGYQKVILNSLVMTFLFVFISILFIWITRLTKKIK